MSISTTLRRATKLQQKIEGLRGQLTQLLERAREEMLSAPKEEVIPSTRRAGRPKMFKSNGRRHGAKAEVAASKTRAGRPGRGAVRAVVERGRKGVKRSPLLGRKRAASPSGPLAPAVVKVLQAKRKPMNVGDILSGLTANGYLFTAAEPKKNLAARIYRLKGVRQVSAGLFAAI